MIEYNQEFLKERGFFETSTDIEDEYTVGDVTRTVSYKFDSKNRLAYFDDFNNKHITEIIKVLRKRRNFDYYWFWKEGRLYAFRTFGENKQFIFNTTHSKRSEYVKSKKDKLEKFTSQNPTSLFEVKDIITRFYRRLWELRLKLAKAIKEDISDREKILAAQRLLDRLIFTYFTAEKGIIYGIDKRGRRLEVSARELFKYLIGVSEDFHSLLNDLFFEYLNSSDKNDMPVKGAEGYSLFIPYLNGGLFRERHLSTLSGKSVGECELRIEGFDWRELIDALNEYNWIIDGYTEVEDEETFGNLTPEILGHIYEKFVITVSELDDIDVDELATTQEGELKKGNKKIGAYYTPEVITKYIAENTIFPFAMDRLGLRGYENFSAFYEAHRGDADTLHRFNSVLKDIKILDPAVGSGAFLLAAADLLFDWRRKCGDASDDYTLRREIIINNLHGVDIMEGAVEICMLRLWLWLIAAVDTGKEIEALPNIDFNIFEGNSLIGYADTQRITDLKPKKEPRAHWATLTHKQFTMDNWGEDSIRQLFQQRNKKIREYKTATGKSAEHLRREIDETTREFNEMLDKKLLEDLQAKKIKIDEETLKKLKPFHWVMQFSDVFEKGGFDVVIGNPPYVRSIRLKENDPIAWQIYRKEYFSASYKEYDIYLPVLERSSGLLSKYGRLGFIMSNKWLHAQMGERARTYFHEKSLVSEIINFKSLQVFVGVTTYTMLVFFANRQNDAIFVRQFTGDPESGVEKAMGNLRGPDWESGRVKYASLTPAPWSFSLGKKAKLMEKLGKLPRFGEYYKAYQGTGTRADDVFFVKKISENKDTVTIYSRYTDKEHIVEKDIVKPSVKGKDISNYAVIEKNNLLIFPYNGKELIPEETMKTEYPLAWEYLKECRDKLESREKGKWKNNNWHRFSYPRAHQYMADKKIIIPAIVNFAEAAYDDVGYHMIDSVYGIRKIADIELDDYYILALLNSRLLTFFLMETGTNLRGGYFTMKSAYLEPFPIPDATKLYKSEGSIYHRIIENVKEIIYLCETSPEESTDRVLKLDEEINQGLYELYGLSDEEATIIEETVKGRCFRDWWSRLRGMSG